MIFDVNRASGALLKIHREVVGTRPRENGSSQLVGIHKVVFETFYGRDAKDSLYCDGAELGFADDDAVPSDSELRKATFPPGVRDALARLFADRPRDEILWLWLCEPYGFLPTLPFDAMLAEALPTHPVVRLSCDNVTSVMFKGARDSALCFSCPRNHVEPAVKSFLASLPEPSRLEGYTIHVFADPAARSLLRKLLAGNKAFAIHDPPDSVELLCKEEVSSIVIAHDVRHPWLAWILGVLEHTAVDFVHFVCHGMLSSDQGALIFAEPVIPDDARMTRPLYATEVDRFLDRLGAWSVSLASPPGNSSIGGLRYFSEQLAQMRYGPVLLQDLAADHDGSQLLNSIRYYVSREGLKPSASVVRYWNPNRDLAHAAAQVENERLHPLIEYAFKSDPETATTVQRAFDTAVARYQRYQNASLGDVADAAVRKGVGDALKFVHKIVTETADKRDKEGQ